MESDHLSPMSANPNRASDIVTYHRIGASNGEYGVVYLSPGFGFFPKDDILITCYLNKKISGEEDPYIRLISTINVYNHNPEELTGSHKSLGEDEWYFFSSRNRKYLNGNRPARAAGNGYWRANGAEKKIYHNDEFVGNRKCLVFYEGQPPNGKKTNWIMLEYVANQPQRQRQGPDDMRLDDCVLCRIYKKSDCSPNKEEQTDSSESGTTEKSAAHKSIENKNQATPKRVKRERQDTELQQLDFPGQLNLQPNPPKPQLNHSQVLEPNPPRPQQNHLQVLQPKPPLPQHNSYQVLQPNPPPPQHHVLQPNPPRPQHNCYQVLQPNPPRTQQNHRQMPVMPQPNPPTPQQNHGQVLQPNPPAPQPILRMQQQNPEIIQYDQQAAGIPDAREPDFLLERIQEDAKHFNFDDLFDIETFVDTMSLDIVRNQACTSEYQHWFGHPTAPYQHSNYLHPYPSFDCFEPKSPQPFGNNYHPPDGY